MKIKSKSITTIHCLLFLLLRAQYHGVCDAFSSSTTLTLPKSDVDDVINVESSQQHYDDRVRQYQPSSPLDQAGGIIYRESVFTKEEFDIILAEVKSLTSPTSLTKEKSSIAVDRLGVTLSPNSQTVEILKKGSLHNLIQRLTTAPSQDCYDQSDVDKLELSSDLPVEVRVYEIEGSGMSWHIDDVLYSPRPQLEVVITLENTSDCVTMWKKKNDGNIIYSQETDPNSVLILKAGGPSHCVTSLKRGKRTILKCAFAYTQSQFCYDQGSHHKQNQFGSSNGAAKQKRNNKKGKKSKR